MNRFLRHRLKKAHLAWLVALAVLARAEERPLSVCEVLGSPEKFNGKIVAVRGLQSATDEGGWLEGIDCAPLVTNGYRWPTVIWLEMSASRLEALNLDFRKLGAETAQLNRSLKAAFDLSRDRMIVTYVGRFYMLEDLAARVDTYNRTGRGLGHANYAPAELVVKQVKDLSIERSVKRGTDLK